MKNILEAPFIREFSAMTSNMYRMGWDERNGGNISYLLYPEDVADYLDTDRVLRKLPVTFDAKPLAGKLFLVTGTSKYFKNIEGDPETNLGIVRITPDGTGADLLWGYKDGGRPTSELAAHLLSHTARLERDPAHRVIIHTHPTNTLAMTHVHPLDERAFTRTLWQMCTECLVVFPDGVGVLPWMVCGTDEIGRVTAEKMKDFRLCVWALHGIFGAGKDLDEAFGLIETVEKAADLYMKILPGKRLVTITDEEFWALADAFGLTPRAGWLASRQQ